MDTAQSTPRFEQRQLQARSRSPSGTGDLDDGSAHSSNPDSDSGVSQPAQFPARLMHNYVHHVGLVVSVSGLFLIPTRLGNHMIVGDDSLNASLMLLYFGALLFSASLQSQAIVASWILKLNFIPSLGSSLWVMLSTPVMTGFILLVGGDDSEISFVQVLVPLVALLSLVAFNMYLVGYVVFDTHAIHINFRPGLMPMSSIPVISFSSGRAIYATAVNQFHNVIGKHLDMPRESLTAFNVLQDRTRLYYCKGERMEEFEEDFRVWKAQMKRIGKAFLMRRLVCAVGILMETTAMVTCLLIFKSLVADSGVEPSYSNYGGMACMVGLFYILCSPYCRMIRNVELTFSTTAEYRALSLMQIQSRWIDWSSPKYTYITNGRLPLGRWLSRMSLATDTFDLPCNETATIGLVYDVEASRNARTLILKNIETSSRLLVCRTGENELSTKPYQAACEESELLQGLRQFEEPDKLTQSLA